MRRPIGNGWISRTSLAIGVSIFVSVVEVCSQTPQPSPGRIPDGLRPPTISDRQIMMNEIERKAAKPRTPEEEKLALKQIADDYVGIQIVNNKMMSVTLPSTAPDYKYVSDAISEIRKRANRLKLNLRLPKPPEEKGKQPAYKHVTDVQSFKAALLSLDKVIMSFVGSPLFRNPDVFDVNHANQLRIDLETIISFTKALNGDLEKLAKSRAKPDQ